MSVAIRIENVSKQYRLGTVGTGTISHDLNRWWHRVRGKEDPYALVGQVNDRTKAAASVEQQETSKKQDPSPRNSQLATRDSYVWALKDINLEVQQGEILGIIGRNGAGKSTLLKLLSRVTAPTTGSIKTKGRIASLLEVGTGFHPELTGRENIYMNGAIMGMRRREITKQLDKIVEFSGCAKYVDTPVKRYSSGMTVRLGFSVAAHLNCEILIVDEVLAVGDAEFQSKCIEKMKDVGRFGKTIFFVSHNLASIEALCRTCVLMNEGAISSVSCTSNTITSYLSKRTNKLSGRKQDSENKGFFLETIGGDEIFTQSGKPLSISFELQAPYILHNAGLGLVVYDKFEAPVVGMSSLMEERTTKLSSSQITIKCDLSTMPINSGNYRIAAWLSENGTDIANFPNAASLVVERGLAFRGRKSIPKEWGNFYWKPSWEFTSNG